MHLIRSISGIKGDGVKRKIVAEKRAAGAF